MIHSPPRRGREWGRGRRCGIQLWCPLSIGGHGKSMMARVMIVEDEE